MKHRWVLPVFLLTAPVLRASAFFGSVVDWDESLYLLIARTVLEGNAPYTAIWNNTPPGIYFIFAPVLFVFPRSIPAIRALTCVVVSLTAFLLYRLGIALNRGDHAIGLTAGALYVLYSSSPAMGGLASNGEIFFNFFTVCGLLTLRTGRSTRNRFLAGLLFGVGFQIKYHVAFDFLAGLLIAGGQILSEKAKSRALMRQCSPMMLGFSLPSVVVASYFLTAGHLQDYAHCAIVSNLIYTANCSTDLGRALSVLADQILAHPLLWVSSGFIGLRLLLGRGNGDRLPILIWFIAGLLGVLATRRFWDHYFLQVLPAMCLLAAHAVLEILRLDMTSLQKAFVLVVLLVSTSMLSPVHVNLNTAVQLAYQRYVSKTDEWKDTPRQIADYVNERAGGGDTIYVVDYQPVIYFLAQAQPPTRYVFPDHLTNPDLTTMTGIDPVAELDAIMEKAPLYVVCKREPDYAPSLFYSTLDGYLAERYVYETSFHEQDGAEVGLYRLRE
jgi:4-amino-4-deoxy-L-arabinose transferase-like glycosyltransferase